MEHIGGSANDRTRTRRILSRLTSEKVTTSVGTNIFGSRLFTLTRTIPGKHTTAKGNDLGFESHAQGHLVDGGSHSPTIAVGKDRDMSIASSEATPKLMEANPAADDLKVEPDTTAQAKSEVGALSATLKAKNQPEKLQDNFDDYNKYDDNRDQTSPLASPGNVTIIGTDPRIKSHDHENVVSVSYSPAVKVERDKDAIKDIPTATSKLNAAKPAADISRIESETSDQTKPAVNAPSEELKIKNQPEMVGRPQLPRIEMGKKSKYGQYQLNRSV